MVIEGKEIEIGYGDKIVVHKSNIKINEGEIVTIIGPNGSGKSTLIKALSRCKKLKLGVVTLDGVNINNIPTKVVAKKMAVLPQMKSISSDITVESLVSFGRFPHLDFRNRLNKEDRNITEWAMEKTGLVELRNRNVMTLSGGERQRAWIAMALAQKPQVLMLDEPTTYLDISYQLEILELIKELNQTLGITVVMVLHDLNQAARYSDNIYVLKDGQICDYGKPQDIMKANLLKDVFRIEADVYEDKVNQCPYFIPSKVI